MIYINERILTLSANIILRKVLPEEINSGFLTGFIRHQETKKVKYWNQGRLEEKDDYFVEEWDEHRLRGISSFLKEVAYIGSVVAAFDNDKVVGFACVDNEVFFGEYVNMPYIHVSYGYRDQGIGKELFKMIEKEAKELGAKKLYISTHPDINTYEFYEKMGCIPAKRINRRLFDIEPLDIQMEKLL